MNQKIIDYLNAPIPRKLAFAAILGSALGSTTVAVIGMRNLTNEANDVIQDLVEKNALLGESIDFLTEKADQETLSELSEKLDYWRVVLGIDPATSEEI